MKSKKIDYQRWTFILSVIGFIGSVGFYLGVLKQVYSSDENTQKIQRLEVENAQLKQQIQKLKHQ